MTADWGWTSTAGWGSGCRPPRWARPSWRCGCPGRGCCQHGEAWSWTQSAPISGGTHTKKKRYVVSQALQVFVRLYLLLLAFMRAWVQTCTCLLSFSRQPCSLMREPAVLSTTVRHRSMCLTDLSLVRAHSLNKSRSKTLAKGRLDLCPLDPKIQPHLSAVIELARLQLDAYSEEWWQCGCDTGS